MILKYIEGQGSLGDALDQIHELLVNDKIQDMQKLVKEYGAAMLSKIFETDPLNEDQDIVNSPKRVKTLSVFVSQCTRILDFEQINCMFNIVNFIVQEGSSSPVLIQMLETYCKQLHLKPDKKFPKQVPIKQLVEKFLSQFELNIPTWMQTIHVLQTLVVFDEAKQIFADNEYLQLFSGLLAAADDVILIKELLGVLHSVLFNIADTNDLYYNLMKQFKSLAPLSLIQAVMEKKDHLPYIRFDLIMLLNGILQPETVELADETIFSFFIESFAIINDQNFVLGQDNVICGVGMSGQEIKQKVQENKEPKTEQIGTGKGVDLNVNNSQEKLNNNEIIQIPDVYFDEYYDILLQNMIRYYSISQENKQQKFNQQLVDSKVVQSFIKFLEQSTYHDNNHLLISFLQLVISNSSKMDSLHDNSIQKEFGCMGTELFKYIGKLTVQLFKGNFKQILQEIEDCCAVLVFISLSFQGGQDGFSNLIQLPEITGFVSFVLSLTQIDQLINTVPALLSLFSLLCKDGTILQLYNNQIQHNVQKSNVESGPKNNLPKTLANLMIQLQSSPQSQVLVFNVLYGLLQKSPNILKEIEQSDFIQILQSFKENDVDEYDDLLADVVNCYGKNEQIITAVEQIIKT